MDIFSHALWAAATGKATNLKKKKPLKVWVMAIFGLFPDFFAFSPAFAYMFASYIFPTLPKISHPGPNQIEPVIGNALLINNLTHNLYDLSHSLIIFFLIFSLTWLIFKRPIWELGGWLIHILMDIPSHSYDFYPTPFLWPVSDFMVNGTRWGTPRFMITNYSLIIAAYLILWILKRKYHMRIKNKV